MGNTLMNNINGRSGVNTARMESTSGLNKNLNPNNDKIDPKFIDTNRARGMLETDRKKGSKNMGISPSVPNMSNTDRPNLDMAKKDDKNIKSTFHSVYNPALKDGKGGSAVEKGPDVWVKKWVDYSSKYGLGYLLSNGATGVFFNDSSKIILDPKGI